MNNEIKASRKKKQARFIKKMQKSAFVSAAAAIVTLCSTVTAFADTPSGVDTTTMDSLIKIVMWVVRGAILFIGGIPALIKVVQGYQNEDARERNGGLAGLAIAGVAIGATFAIQPLLSSF